MYCNSFLYGNFRIKLHNKIEKFTFSRIFPHSFAYFKFDFNFTRKTKQRGEYTGSATSNLYEQALWSVFNHRRRRNGLETAWRAFKKRGALVINTAENISPSAPEQASATVACRTASHERLLLFALLACDYGEPRVSHFPSRFVFAGCFRNVGPQSLYSFTRIIVVVAFRRSRSPGVRLWILRVRWLADALKHCAG